MPLLAATAGVLRHGRDTMATVRRLDDDMLPAETRCWTAAREIPILLDVGPAVALAGRPSTSPYGGADRHAGR
jgi:hypothetical protein